MKTLDPQCLNVDFYFVIVGEQGVADSILGWELLLLLSYCVYWKSTSGVGRIVLVT